MAYQFPNLDPVALSLGPLDIRWYALAYLAGILLGWFYAAHWARRDEGAPTAEHIDDFVSWAVLGVILGGRLGYALFYNAPYYLDNPVDILKLWEGGMSFHGGVLGVFAAMLAFARFKEIPFLRLADIVCAAAPIGLFFGRIANFINGELYGRATDGPWGMIFPGSDGQPRHPSQLYEAALEGLLLFIVLFVLMRVSFVRARAGFVAGAFVAGYGAARSVIELVREPDAHLGFIFMHLSMGQLLSLPMILLGLCVMIFAVKKGDIHAKAPA